jgi:hypothetical protein
MKMKMKYLVYTFVGLFLFGLLFVRIPNNQSVLAQQVKEVIVANFPDIFNTREQNVDENGNIKVAQQGEVDVNVVNQSSNPESKIITVFDNQALTPSGTIYSESFDVSEYKKIGLFVSKPSGYIIVRWEFSLDDTNWYVALPDEYMSMLSNFPKRYSLFDVAGAKLRVRVENSGSEPAPSVSISTYLIP